MGVGVRVGKAAGDTYSMSSPGLLASNGMSGAGGNISAGRALRKGLSLPRVLGMPHLARLEGCSEQSPYELGSEASLPSFESWLLHLQLAGLGCASVSCL